MLPLNHRTEKANAQKIEPLKYGKLILIYKLYNKILNRPYLNIVGYLGFSKDRSTSKVFAVGPSNSSTVDFLGVL